MKINLDDDHVSHHQMTVEQVRSFLDGNADDELETKLDEAQGPVFTGERDVSYLVIEIRK